MAITKSSPSNMPQKTKKRLVASVWLITALLVSAAALALWMFSAAPVFDDEKKAETEVPPEAIASKIDQVTRIDKLNELNADVKPISFDALVRDLRDYPPEFKDAKYLKKFKGKWTVQVMDVSEHEIITDYLNSRKDRQKFAYFRYRDSNNQPRYLLTYDVMPSEQLAVNAASSVDFDLPANVQVIPEEISGYLTVIENYELSAPIKDLSRNRARQVKLQATRSEIAPRRRIVSEPQSSNNSSQAQSQSSDSSGTNNSSARPSSDIKTSNNTNDTLSVQEERKVVSPSEGNIQPSVEPTPPKNNAKPKEEAAKPKAEKPKPEPTKPAEASKNTQKSGNDSIKQLIDEKTE
ncbi:hypothetical protein [Psychrobacter sanguinis]|uniref:Uncharacterized protein n=2 Tax=Psychrobacter TaxID=497 RepID=A0A844LYL7_9GAMM|nr:hypothetical protein [Psychrobacter sanguinis]MUG31428.1 hypothetical protein [Psychrobacter sanguinis]